jgi:hypothetical protein
MRLSRGASGGRAKANLGVQRCHARKKVGASPRHEVKLCLDIALCPRCRKTSKLEIVGTKPRLLKGPALQGANIKGEERELRSLTGGRSVEKLGMGGGVKGLV